MSHRIRIRRGNRITELVLAPVARVTWDEIAALAAARGTSGSGSMDGPEHGT